jgi:hypothetical protein
MALLEASNIQDFITAIGGVNNIDSTPFSFLERDLYADFYSYSSLALANYNRSALLDDQTLMNISQKVFSTFFQSFISLDNGYDGYWAYQPAGYSLPSDLDFEPPLTTTVSYSSTQTLTSCYITQILSSAIETITTNSTVIMVPTVYSSPSCVPTATEITTESWTITQTLYPEISSSSTSSPSQTSQAFITTRIGELDTLKFYVIFTNLAASSLSGSPLGETAGETTDLMTDSISNSPLSTEAASSLVRRTITSSTASTSSSTSIPATITTRTQLLVVSSLAVFLSIGILALLIVLAIVVYIVSNRYLRLLPRDIDSPASLLAFVYGSKKLLALAKYQDEIGVFNAGAESSLKRRKTSIGETSYSSGKDGEPLAGMGYFTDSDGKERWGIELETLSEANIPRNEFKKDNVTSSVLPLNEDS